MHKRIDNKTLAVRGGFTGNIAVRAADEGIRGLYSDVPVLAHSPNLLGAIDGSWAGAPQLPVSYNFTYQRLGPSTLAYIPQDADGLDVAFSVTQKEPLIATQQSNGPGIVGARRLMGRNNPNSFQSPDVPSPPHRRIAARLQSVRCVMRLLTLSERAT